MTFIEGKKVTAAQAHNAFVDLCYRGLLQAEAWVNVVDLFNKLGYVDPMAVKLRVPHQFVPPGPTLLPSWKLHCPNPNPNPNVRPGRCLSRPSLATVGFVRLWYPRTIGRVPLQILCAPLSF